MTAQSSKAVVSILHLMGIDTTDKDILNFQKVPELDRKEKSSPKTSKKKKSSKRTDSSSGDKSPDDEDS